MRMKEPISYLCAIFVAKKGLSITPHMHGNPLASLNYVKVPSEDSETARLRLVTWCVPNASYY
jgi:hypothetical protein